MRKKDDIEWVAQTVNASDWEKFFERRVNDVVECKVLVNELIMANLCDLRRWRYRKIRTSNRLSC